MQRPWYDRLKSRKLWVALLAAILPVLNEQFGWNIPVESVVTTVGALLAWVLAEAYTDAHK